MTTKDMMIKPVTNGFAASPMYEKYPRLVIYGDEAREWYAALDFAQKFMFDWEGDWGHSFWNCDLDAMRAAGWQEVTP